MNLLSTYFFKPVYTKALEIPIIIENYLLNFFYRKLFLIILHHLVWLQILSGLNFLKSSYFQYKRFNIILQEGKNNEISTRNNSHFFYIYVVQCGPRIIYGFKQSKLNMIQLKLVKGVFNTQSR